MPTPEYPNYHAQSNTWEVKPPDPKAEKLVPYYSYASECFEHEQGRSPSRNSLTKYVYEKPGFPVLKGGPYVKVPIIIQLKRVYTTEQAMKRFFKLIAKIEKEEGVTAVSY